MRHTKHTSNESFISTEEITEWLKKRTKASSDLGMAFLSSWTGILQWTALLQIRNQANYQFDDDGWGAFILHLNSDFVPEEHNAEEMIARIGDEIALDYQDTGMLYRAFIERLTERIQEVHNAVFEPLGNIEHNKWNKGYLAKLHEDLLQPTV